MSVPSSGDRHFFIACYTYSFLSVVTDFRENIMSTHEFFSGFRALMLTIYGGRLPFVNAYTGTVRVGNSLVWSTAASETPPENPTKADWNVTVESEDPPLEMNLVACESTTGMSVMPTVPDQKKSTVRNKLTVIIETSGMNEAKLATYCREKRLNISEVRTWREIALSAQLKPLSGQDVHPKATRLN